jgi:hypothetical protein
MDKIAGKSNLHFIVTTNTFKVDVDEDDIRSLNDNDIVCTTVYLDFVQFLCKGHCLSFLKNTSSNGNNTMLFKKQTWTKPPFGLQENKTNGHYFHLGTIRGKYEVHLSFTSSECDCHIHNQELHVKQSIGDIIVDAVHAFLSEFSEPLTGYYCGKENLYATSQPYFIPLRYFLKTDNCSFPVLSGHSFFENHELSFLVTCIGQNDEVSGSDAIMLEINSTFNLDRVQDMRMSLAYSVSAKDFNQCPLSVVISKEAFEDDFLNGLSEPRFFTKCFSNNFVNFQAQNFPGNLSRRLATFSSSPDNPSVNGEKLNFYNGKSKSCH